jgi:hypothetical protein
MKFVGIKQVYCAIHTDKIQVKYTFYTGFIQFKYRLNTDLNPISNTFQLDLIRLHTGSKNMQPGLFYQTSISESSA